MDLVKDACRHKSAVALAFTLALIPLLLSPVVARITPGQFGDKVTEAAGIPYRVLVPVVFKNYAEPYRDDFSNSASGWPISTDTISSVGYVGGQYHILVKQSGYVVTAGNNLLANDFRVEVDAYAAASIDGSNGLYFGHTDAGFYLFEVAYGQFRLSRYDVSTKTWTTLINPKSDPAIRSGNQVNRLKVTRSGSTITLFANGQQLSQIADSTFGQGYIGLAVGAVAANYDARFDNFLLVFNTTDTTTQGIQSMSVESYRETEVPGFDAVLPPLPGPPGWR